MSKIKLTKSELKRQKDALKQFRRFLPTLQLKKQQLQLESRKKQIQIDKNIGKEIALKEKIASYIAIFSIDKDKVIDLGEYIKIKGIKYSFSNIAGVKIPVFNSIEFQINEYDLFYTPIWIDEAIEIICKMVEIRVERIILEEQLNRLNMELKITTQRVNLFEKVKIPETKENIRKIQIYLGDEQTAAVCRSKIAKKKLAEISL